MMCGVTYSGVNVKNLFRSAARKLAEDFASSEEAFSHLGQRGEYREHALKDFLAHGRLPEAYGVTSGSIVSPSAERSAQTDLLFHDRLRGPSFLAHGNAALFPIESVYGICEVKSTLGKAELVDAFHKIEVFKRMTPSFGRRHATSVGAPVERFGLIFAYRASTSIEALLGNLRELQAATEPRLWPNLVAVLDGDVLVNRRVIDEALFAHQLADGYGAERLYAGADVLFEFYARLNTLLSYIRLDPFDIRLYGRLGANIGGHHVHGHMWGTSHDTVRRYTDAFLLKVIAAWQAERGVRDRPHTYGDVLRYQLGSVPDGMGERALAMPAFLYNPTKVPPTQSVNAFIKKVAGEVFIDSPLLPSHSFYVGEVQIVVPEPAVKADDTELVVGLAPADL